MHLVTYKMMTCFSLNCAIILRNQKINNTTCTLIKKEELGKEETVIKIRITLLYGQQSEITCLWNTYGKSYITNKLLGFVCYQVPSSCFWFMMTLWMNDLQNPIINSLAQILQLRIASFLYWINQFRIGSLSCFTDAFNFSKHNWLLQRPLSSHNVTEVW